MSRVSPLLMEHPFTWPLSLFPSQVQEAASQGLKFVGVIPQYQDPRNPAGCSLPADTRGARLEPGECVDPEAPGTPVGADGSPEPGQGPGVEAPATQQPSWPSGEAAGKGSSPHGVGRPLDGPDGAMAGVRAQQLSGTEMEILALFNKPKSHQKCRQYYPVTIPLRVSKNGQTVSGLDANWLEHMSDHFRKGGELVNAVFYLGLVNGMEHSAGAALGHSSLLPFPPQPVLRACPTRKALPLTARCICFLINTS